MPLNAPKPKLSRGAPLSLTERYLERALDFYTRKKYDEALVDLDAALEVEPRNGELYATRGYILLESGADEEAEADFTRALALDPRQWLVHYARALTAFKGEAYATALRHLRAAERIVPERPEVLIYKAAVHYYLDEKEAAQTAIDTAEKNLDADDKRMREARKWAKAIKQMPALPNQDEV